MALICKRLKKEYQIPISWSDLRGDMLERGKLYCKLAGLPLAYEEQSWREINSYSMIRDCIVHKNGAVKGFQYEQELRTYATQNGIISQDTIEQEIALTEQFCRDIIKTIRTFLGKLYEAYELQRLKQKQKPKVI